jgi:choline dehydrogenase-like flavoprotein
MTRFENTIHDGTPHYDVVIIGAGAAGVTLARKIGDAGGRVALLEGGDYVLTGESQQMYETDIIGHVYSTTSTRMRMFGGGTNCWGGYVCRQDDDTFQARGDLFAPYPGWPIDRSELDPYFQDALEIVDIPRDAPWKPAAPNPFDRFNTMMGEMEMQELYWNVSPPTRFVLKYREEVEKHPNVDALMNHSLIDVETDADGTVTACVFASIDGEITYRITGDRYILACGGIENPRLLLYLNEKNGTSYGNASGMLGHHFMEHPELDVAQFVMTDTSYQHRVNNHAYRFYRPTREWQLRDNMAGAILRLSFTHEEEQAEIIGRLATVSNLQPQPGWQAGYIMISWEQMPLPSNRVALSPDMRDALGIPVAELHWQLAQEDYHAPRLLVDRFARMMNQHDMGRVRLFDWIMDESARPDPLWAKHHIGTTRMAANEREGCVDTNGLLFGTKNFYVMGASLFPTAGYENPTVPVIQLALRMSDYMIDTLQA